MHHVRTLLAGVLSGALLSAARLPLGWEPLSLPAVSATQACAVRGGALVALGLALGLARGLFARRGEPQGGDGDATGRRGLTARITDGLGLDGTLLLLAGAALGFAAHAWLRPGLERPGLWMPLGALGLLAVLVALVGRGRADGARPESDDALGAVSLGGLALLGAGLALALEGLARGARLLTTTATLDEDVLAVVLLASVAAGALAFGSLLRTPRARRVGLLVGAALAILACTVSLSSLADLARSDGWNAFVRRFGMLPNHRGHVRYDLALGAVVFTLPAAALGVVLRSAGRAAWSALLVGAGVGIVLAPRFVAEMDSEIDTATFGLNLPLLAGSLLGAAGLGLAGIAARGAALAARGAAAAGAVGVGCVAAFLGPPFAGFSAAPWSVQPVRPTLVLATPEGWITVEPNARGVECVTLDRRVLAAELDIWNGHETSLDASLEVFHEVRDGRGWPRVLLVGQLTPHRMTGLQGVRHVDRTGAWHASMERLEEHLFRLAPGQPPAGDVISPAKARARIANGDYDLVWIPPVEGGSPVLDLDGLEVPEHTTLSAWIVPDLETARRSLPARALFAESDVEAPALGFVGGEGARALEEEELRPLAFDARASCATPLAHLALHAHQRRAAALRELGVRFAESNRGGELETFADALAHFYAIQEESSPWATWAEATEVDARVLELAGAAVRTHPRHEASRRFFEGLAYVLLGQRRIDLIAEHVEPVHDAVGSSTSLDFLLVEADLEGLLYQQALDRVRAMDADGPWIRALEARALEGLGRTGEALDRLLLEVGRSGWPDDVLLGALAETVVRGGEEAAALLRARAPELVEDPSFQEALAEARGEHDHDH